MRGGWARTGDPVRPWDRTGRTGACRTEQTLRKRCVLSHDSCSPDPESAGRCSPGRWTAPRRSGGPRLPARRTGERSNHDHNARRTIPPRPVGLRRWPLPAGRSCAVTARPPDTRGLTATPSPGSHEPTDEEIGKGLVQGDENCLALAYRRWGGLVQTLATRAIGDAREAEDVTQQVFFAAWRGREGYRPERGPVPAWLVGIARRKVADALSARTRRTELVAAAAPRCPRTWCRRTAPSTCWTGW